MDFQCSRHTVGVLFGALVASCGGNSGLFVRAGQSQEKSAQGQGAEGPLDAREGAQGPKDPQTENDREAEPVDTPMPITGAFLTCITGIALDPAHGVGATPLSQDERTYGCSVTDSNGVRIDNKIENPDFRAGELTAAGDSLPQDESGLLNAVRGIQFHKLEQVGKTSHPSWGYEFRLKKGQRPQVLQLRIPKGVYGNEHAGALYFDLGLSKLTASFFHPHRLWLGSPDHSDGLSGCEDKEHIMSQQGGQSRKGLKSTIKLSGPGIFSLEIHDVCGLDASCADGKCVNLIVSVKSPESSVGIFSFKNKGQFHPNAFLGELRVDQAGVYEIELNTRKVPSAPNNYSAKDMAFRAFTVTQIPISGGTDADLGKIEILPNPPKKDK